MIYKGIQPVNIIYSYVQIQTLYRKKIILFPLFVFNSFPKEVPFL
ncbi:hypothetical protein HMPREF0083_04009, partial [Aneurinibacillus aneurinilyticus ATCC 12856]